MPVEHISPQLFEKLVDLAAIALDPSESEYLRSELNNQLTAIKELMAIKLDETLTPALHGVPFESADRQAMREDTLLPYATPEDIISQAPQSEDNYIVVQDIPHSELD